MKSRKTYLKAKSVFIVSLIVIGLTISIVYLTGLKFDRTIELNSYYSLTIIGLSLVMFMTYGLYNGIDLLNNYPVFKKYRRGAIFDVASPFPEETPDLDIGDGIEGVIMSILIWIGMTILFIVLLFLVEAIFWFSIMVLIAMLYWVFFRALKLVFSKSNETEGKIGLSLIYSISYSVLYIGWLYAVVYLVEGYLG
ncbi:hypothetical protein [Lutimonas sp.]|uniref:hypothetical protein n=1 Tax=Lutimonas sp. TaxID=1872403 RepID=UPI003D9AC56D